MRRNSCDVCLFTSVPDEFKALRRIFERLGNIAFTADFTESGRSVFVGTIQNLADEPLALQISCLPEMGGSSAALHIHPILNQYRPRFVGMTGICAGDREKVALGDLIVAIRAYEYEAGKVVLHDGKPTLLPDVKTFSPNDNIIDYVNHFDDWKEDVAKLKRAPSKRQQREWLLSMLASPGKRVGELDPQLLQEKMPQWQTISTEMTRGQKPLLAEDLTLTEHARQFMRSSWIPYRDRGYAEQFSMVMGSGRAVRSDNPFPLLRAPERKLIAIEMEGASVYQAVENFPDLAKRALVVKGVSDYGDEDKDDTYREYASEASAIYMLHFIRRYVNQKLMPRLFSVSADTAARDTDSVSPKSKAVTGFTNETLRIALCGNDPLEAQAAMLHLVQNDVDPTPFLLEVLEALNQEYLAYPVSYRLPRQFAATGEKGISGLIDIITRVAGDGNWFAAIEAASCFRFLPREKAGSELAKLLNSNDADVVRCAIEGLGWLGYWEWSHRIRKVTFEDDEYFYEKLRFFSLGAAFRMLSLSTSTEIAGSACTRIEDWIDAIRQREQLDSKDILREWKPVTFEISAPASDIIVSRWLKTSNVLHVQLAIEAAKNSRIPRAIPGLLNVLQSDFFDAETRISAAIALSEIGSPAAKHCHEVWRSSCGDKIQQLSDTCRGLVIAFSTVLNLLPPELSSAVEGFIGGGGWWGGFEASAVYSGAASRTDSSSMIACLDSDNPELRGAASIALAIIAGKSATDHLLDRLPHLSTPLERMLTYAALQRIGHVEYGNKLYLEMCRYPTNATPDKILKLPFLWRREFVNALSLENGRGAEQSVAWGELLAVRSHDLATVVRSTHEANSER